MLKKLIVTLIASAFAVTAFAQSSTTTPSSPAPAEKKADKMDKKASKKAKSSKGEKKASSKSTKGKGKAKSDEAKK